MRSIKRKINYRPIPPYDLECILLTLIRTHQLWQQRLKKESDDYVYIKGKEIALYKPMVEQLINERKLSVIKRETLNGFSANYYKVLIPGLVNFNLLEPKGSPLNSLHLKMMDHLLDVTLSNGTPSTQYFDAFMFYRKSNPHIFFTVDSFAHRVHTPVTSLSRELRTNILLKGEETVSLDVCTMQPLILGKILEMEIGENDFSNWINCGQDIYLILQNKTNLGSRKDAKEKFYAISYGKSSSDLKAVFGFSNWINWIDELKSKPLNSNPHTHLKQHSNLAWLMQTTEVKILTKAWKLLVEFNIPFLTVHDEIIVRKSDFSKTEEILSQVLSNEFTYFRINSDYNPPPQPDG
ncbi:MAG: hypothetical protein WCP69_13070 [Bacteroidota bacterium]